jgi:hypothetical protein
MEKTRYYLSETLRDRYANFAINHGFNVHTYRMIYAGIMVYCFKYWKD